MTGTYRFTIDAGLFIRGQLRRDLKKVLHVHFPEHSIEEDKGFLGSTFYIRARGNVDKLKILNKALEDWEKRLNEDESDE